MTTLAVTLDFRVGEFSLELDETLELNGITALFGASGAGKTTLLRILSGLERRANGRVALNETVWQDTAQGTNVSPHDRGCGYIFQDGRLFSHLSVEGNLRFADTRSKSGNKRAGFDNVIKALDLSALLGRDPGSLSGGEQQRVAMGRALLCAPRLMLMDEPLSALDLPRKTEIAHYIERLANDFDLPILYVTHNTEEVTRLASEMIVISDGRIAARGNVAEVLERADLWPLTGRVDAGAVLEGVAQTTTAGMTGVEIEGQTLRIPAIDVSPGTRLRLSVQARDVALATQRPDHLSIRNVLSAQILSIDLDDTVFAELLLEVGAQHLRSRITREAANELRLTEGQTVFALIKSVAFEGKMLI